MDVIDTIHAFLEDWGIWTILVLFVAKFVTGVLVAVAKNEYKWFYIGNAFKSDGLKIAAFAIMTGLGKLTTLPQLDSDWVQAGMGAVLVTDLTAGVVKNLAHLFPGLSDNIPSAFREPARLRLGNPKNLPTNT